jgi:hypothetical protein
VRRRKHATNHRFTGRVFWVPFNWHILPQQAKIPLEIEKDSHHMREINRPSIILYASYLVFYHLMSPKKLI